MKAFKGSFIVAGLVGTLSMLACSSAPESAEEVTEVSADSLTSLGRSLVGDFHYADGKNFYETLKLANNGKYEGTWKACPPTGRCRTNFQNGNWSTRTSTGPGSPSTLTLRPRGALPKTFTLSVAGDGTGFKMTAAVLNGETERFERDVVAPITCESNADCASNEECRLVSICPPPPPGGVTCMAMANKCIPVAQAGESCGFRTQTIECATGLECRHTGGPLDALSCARPLGQLGEFCGGIAGFQCAADLECRLDGTFPDAGGTCVRPLGQLGEFCGGIAGFQCAANLRCVLTGSFPDAGGTCQFCPIPSCAAPPPGCHYVSQTPPPGRCPARCGRLVCDGSDL